MKTLIINGSPRKDGHCADVIKYIADRLDCDIINCCFENIAHCTGCDACKTGACVINDDMQPLYEKIKAADNIFFVSPLYFSMLTGALLTFASRWQYFYHHPIQGEKQGAVIVLGGGSTKDTSKALSTAKIILRYAGIKDPYTAKFVGTDTALPLEDKKFTSAVDYILKNLMV